jgi:hypothetical protein
MMYVAAHNKRMLSDWFFAALQTSRNASVELNRCAEPNADSIECINLIESVRLKKM